MIDRKQVVVSTPREIDGASVGHWGSGEERENGGGEWWPDIINRCRAVG
jgi:hypothetical protein